jgi:hypothetical protein
MSLVPGISGAGAIGIFRAAAVGGFPLRTLWVVK